MSRYQRAFLRTTRVMMLTLIAGTTISGLGCGTKLYEERLARSAEFNDYLKGLDNNLGRPWIRNDVGMSMRLPLPFDAPMAAPKVEKDENGEVIPVVDPRQDTPMGIDLEGLIDAWQVKLDSASESADCWIYVLSNQGRLSSNDPNAPAAADFIRTIEGELMEVAAVTVADGESRQKQDNGRYLAQFPSPLNAASKYTTPQNFSVIHFVPEFPILDKNVNMLVASRRVDKVQAVFLIVYPKDAPMQLLQRVESALGTWTVSNVIPQATKKAGTTGGTTGGAVKPSQGNF